jgi:type I restriction enzyme S subunit
VKAGWQLAPLGALAEVSAGNPAPQAPALFENGTLPFFRTADAGRIRFGDIFESKDFLNKEGSKKLRLYPKGTILFPKSGASTFLNHRVMLAVDGYVSSHLATVVVKKDKIYGRYLLYYLSTIAAQDLVQDHSYPSLNLPLISGIEVAFPPLPEQRRIVGILDEAFAGLEAMRANAEKNLEHGRQLFDAYLNAVLMRKGDKWVERTLGESCVVERGSSPRPIKNYITTDSDGENWVKIGDTKDVFKDVLKTNQKITKEGALRSRRVEPGDLILTNSMSYGRPYVMGISGYIHDGWFALKPNSYLDTDFFFFLLLSKFVQDQFHKLAAGAIVLNISGDLVKKAVLPIPPLSKQKILVEQFAELKLEVQQVQEIFSRKLDAIDELKKSLLHQAFSGNL